MIPFRGRGAIKVLANGRKEKMEQPDGGVLWTNYVCFDNINNGKFSNAITNEPMNRFWPRSPNARTHKTSKPENVSVFHGMELFLRLASLPSIFPHLLIHLYLASWTIFRFNNPIISNVKKISLIFPMLVEVDCNTLYTNGTHVLGDIYICIGFHRLFSFE